MVADCGVRPTWPITGIPASTIPRARETAQPIARAVKRAVRIERAERYRVGVQEGILDALATAEVAGTWALSMPNRRMIG